MSMPWRQRGMTCAAGLMAMLLAGCQTTGAAHDSATAAGAPSVSQPIPLPPTPGIVVSELPPELSTPTTPPSFAALPPEADVLTSDEVLDRLRARLSTPTCIIGPNNMHWRDRYAGYPQRFADNIQAILPIMLVVLDELETHKLPGEFALIPIVESWYKPDAHGFGGPAGMWQLMAQTARNNGATVINGYDGRLSPLDATRAALNYLEKLQEMFGDWRLAAMGYNSGEFRVIRAMSPEELQHSSAGDGYHRPDGLSGITYEYIAKLRALTCLLAHPELRSIPLPKNVPVTHWIPLTIPNGIASLDELAQRLGVDASELKSFNQGFRKGRIVTGAPRTVLVPAASKPRWDELGGASMVQSASKDTDAVATPDPDPNSAPAPAEQPPAAGSATDNRHTHSVRKGETLSSIAHRYHLTTIQLRHWNSLKRNERLLPGQLLKLEP